MRAIAQLLLLVPLILSQGCIPFRQSGYHDDKVSVRETGWLTTPPSHAAHEKLRWEFFGKTYLDVRGSAPFYLEIPDKNAILFVTGIDGKAVVHLVDNTTHQDRSFPACDSHIGKFIGKIQSPTFHEKIEGIANNTLTISAGNGRIEAKYFIDLKTPEFLREEGAIISPGTPTPERYVYPGGVKPPSR